MGPSLSRLIDLGCSGCRLQDSGPSTADDSAGPDQDARRVCPTDVVRSQGRRRKPQGTAQDARGSLRTLRSQHTFLCITSLQGGHIQFLDGGI